MKTNLIKPNDERGNRILKVFYVLLFLSVVTLVSDYMEYRLLLQESILDEEATANDLRQGLVAGTWMIVYIVAIVCFIQWFRRAYNNLHLLGVKGLSYEEGWASGAWFVPFINLVRPYTIMKEIWEETQTFINESRANNEGSALVGFWWALFLIGNIISNIASRMSLSAQTIEDFQTAATGNMISTIFNIGALYLVIMIIKKIMPWEEIIRTKGNTTSMNIEDHLID